MVPFLAEGSQEVQKSFPMPPIGFGLLALGVLMLALYVVTRFNPDR